MANVLHLLKPAYFFGSIFPFAAVILCWCLFYGLKHHQRGRVLTISETVVPFPESRVFAIAMNIEAWVIILVFCVRNAMFGLYANRSNREYECAYIAYRWVMYACTALVPLGLIILSAVTLENNEIVHLIGAFLFFVGMLLYNAVSDIGLRWAKAPTSNLSFMFTWVAIGCAVLYVIFLGGFQGNVKMTNAGGVFQYLTCLAIFAKIFCYQYDLPNHYFVIEQGFN